MNRSNLKADHPDAKCTDKLKPCYHCDQMFHGPEGLILTCCPACKLKGHRIENNQCTACRIKFEGKLPFSGYH